MVTANYEFLKVMGDLKKEVGEREYYALLGWCGYEKANRITKPEEQESVYHGLLDILRGELSMGQGINSCHFIGNLGRDPEVRYTTSGMAVCNFSIAVGDREKKDGDWVDVTEWVNVVVFDKTAENCEKYLSKGKQCYVNGKMKTRKWQDKEGNDRWTTEIVAFNVQFLSNAD